MAQKLLLQQLKDVGSKLEILPSTKDALIDLLQQTATSLTKFEQSPSKAILESMQPFLNVIVKPELVKHQDSEVKLLVATCICEITRITAPEAPYSDDVLKDIFQLLVSTFSGLSDTTSPSFERRVLILETMARYRSCVVMLDLELDELISEMFTTFLSVASDCHPESVFKSMQTIMIVLLEENEDVPEDLLHILLSVLGRNKKDVTMAARKLAMNVIEQCVGKLEAGMKQFFISSISGDIRSLECKVDYHEAIYDIYRCAPQLLSGVIPYLTGELLSDKLETRLKAVELVGSLFALPESATCEIFQPIFLEFMKRLTDRAVEVRMSILEYFKLCLLSSPSRPEASQIIPALCERLLDYDENVRKQVVAVISDVSCCDLTSVPVETIKLVADRLRDKSILVKKYTMERLAEIYRKACSIKSEEYDWIPGKLLRCFYDKDFRSDAVEPILCMSLFPSEFTVKERVGNWIRVFSGFDKVEVKALERILEQKQRLQQEMLRYLSLRQMYQVQDSDAVELQKKAVFCFRIMSRCFTDPAKAEENFLILDQLKDDNIWKIMSTLLDQSTNSLLASHSREDLLKILGEKHQLYEFLSTLSLKCSYILFNKEHVKEILLEVDIQKSAGNTQLTLACMNILVVLAFSSPLLLGGIEEDLVHLLEDDNEIIKEGVLHVLAKAGGTIREQLGVSSSSLDLILERICLEGSRTQAKYAVHALAAITKDDGLMSLSVLYKRLVDMLEGKKHLPAVLQSLGCIAQTAMPVFETRESEIEAFIKKDILCSHKVGEEGNNSWEDISEVCTSKIFGIKTLVKSYLPVKDAHLRLGIDDLLGTLKNILSFGEISKDIESSSIDKAHLRLAAAKAVLRLSKLWDNKIPIEVLYLTLTTLTLEVNFPQAKRLFLNKVHQYIKDRVLDPKYAFSFLFDIGSHSPDTKEEAQDKQYLSDIIQSFQQGKARQVSLQDVNSSVGFPVYILPYVVHALAHHPSFPNVDECKDVKSFEPIYRKLHFFLSMLVHGDEDGKSEVSVKEGCSSFVSVFENIKRSVDNVDMKKSKNSHAICDLGLSIIKRIGQKQDDLPESSASVSLPLQLYMPREIKEGDDPLVTEGKTWLAEESALTHFELLVLEANGTRPSEIAEDESSKDSETDGNEVPLGKIIKRLKAKGAKARKHVRNEALPVEEKTENEVDILQMVREINVDNLGSASGKLESNNGHEYSGKGESDKKKKRVVESESADVPVPKRQRSAKGRYKLSLTKPGQEESFEMDEDVQMGSESKMQLDEGENSKVVTKGKGKRSARPHKPGGTRDFGFKQTDTDMVHGPTNSMSVSPAKKRKRRSVAGLAKCTSKGDGDSTTDLIDCRIKIWWPMDKEFYEGVVKSYDHEKKKHVVLYDDGDIEVLRLDKERWELVDKSRKPVERINFSKSPPSKEKSHEGKMKTSGDLRKKKRAIEISPSSSKVKAKRTPRKYIRGSTVSRNKAASTESADDIEDRVEAAEVSSPLQSPNKMSDNDLDTEEEKSERIESENNEKSVSGEKEVDNAESNSSDAEEDSKADSGGEKTIEEEEEEEHEEREEESREAAVEDNDDEKSGLQGNEEEDHHQRSDAEMSHSEAKEEEEDDDASRENSAEESDEETEAAADKAGGVLEFSDDEPLGMWQRRVAKSLAKK
jgi:sister-chromatid-cohesion protein PDS5